MIFHPQMSLKEVAAEVNSFFKFCLKIQKIQLKLFFQIASTRCYFFWKLSHEVSSMNEYIIITIITIYQSKNLTLS